MDTSELLRTPLNVFLLTLVLVLAFLAAYRIKKKWLRLPVRIVFSIGAALSILQLVAFMLCARGKPDETVTEVRNGSYKVLIRSQEFHHSGSINVDVCGPIAQALHFLRTRSSTVFFTATTFPDWLLNGDRGRTSKLHLIADE